jgi:hypothetical protein
VEIGENEGLSKGLQFSFFRALTGFSAGALSTWDTMTTVNIKLSQAVVDFQQDQEGSGVEVADDLGAVLDAFAITSNAIGQNYLYYSAWSLIGSTLRLDFPDGASRTITGVQLADPAAQQGRASATNTEMYVPSAFTLSIAGQMHYDYVINGLNLSFGPSSTQPSTFSSMRIATHVPSSSPDYDQDLGNVTLGLDGAMTLYPNGIVQGKLTRITATADKLVKSSVIEGQFDAYTDLNTAGQGMSHSSVGGVVTAYKTAFYDGSYFNVTDAKATVTPTMAIEDSLMRTSSGNDTISIDLPAKLYKDMVVESWDGNDVISLKGGGGRLYAVAGGGNDVISLLGDSHRVDGGLGVDTVKLSSARADVALAPVGSPVQATMTATDKSGTVNTLVNIERIVFTDASLALDIDGNAGQAYRLYQAAFNRTPDSVGLGFWINSMDKGASLNGVAASFIGSNEFKAIYGANPTNKELVTRFYENILHRQPEAAGLDYWVGVLDKKTATTAEVLSFISESGENKAALIGVIGNGFTYTPYEQG